MGQVNYITGHVRFTAAVSGGTAPVVFNNAGGAAEDNDPTNATTLLNSRNLQLDRRGAESRGLQFAPPPRDLQQHPERLTGVIEAVGQRDLNVGIQSGTFTMTIPGVGGPDSLITDDGSGNLVVHHGGRWIGLSAGALVGTINYLDGSVRFNTVLNPRGMPGVRANYTLDRIVAPDVAYSQLGNGGFDADNGTAFTSATKETSK